MSNITRQDPPYGAPAFYHDVCRSERHQSSPNTLIALSCGVNHGTLKSLPLLLGISGGFAFMVLVIGLGIGQFFVVYPELSNGVKVVGALYLIYLAWMIASTAAAGQQVLRTTAPGFFTGVLFQWSNAKAWAVSLSAVATFTSPAGNVVSQTMLLAGVFLLVGIACVGIWVLFGSFVRQRMTPSRHLRKLNLVLAVLLLGSVLPVIGKLWASTYVSLN